MLRIAQAATFFFLLAVSGINASAQDSGSAGFAAGISPAEMRKHLYILASDSLQGRETGTDGLNKAAAYISNTFSSAGIPPFAGSYYQKYTLKKIKDEHPAFILNGETQQFGTDFYNFPFRGDAHVTETSILFLGNISTARIEGLDIAGKCVLVIQDGHKPKSEEGKKATKNFHDLREKKPAVILYVEPKYKKQYKKVKEYLYDYTEFLSTEEDSESIKKTILLHLSEKSAANIFKRNGKKMKDLVESVSLSGDRSVLLSAEIEITKKCKSDKTSAQNVLGYIEGSDKKGEVIVISAHYDHLGERNGKIYHGADDDGSGTTAILEIAKAFASAKKNGAGPRRSILCLANSGEEKGLLGSDYYVHHPVFPLDSTVADLNIDMIGRIDKKHSDDSAYVYVIGSGMICPELKNINESCNDRYTHFTLDYTFDDPKDPNRFYYRSDHYNFAKKNIPVAFYFNGVHDDYHQPSDTADKINYELMARRAQLVFHTAWELANREERIKPEVKKEEAK